MGSMRRSHVLALALFAVVTLLLLLAKLFSSGLASLLGSGNYTERLVLTSEMYEPGHSQPHAELCAQLGVGLRLLILVSSALSHVEQRNAVRQTWGYYAHRADVALGFMLGSSPGGVQAALAAEDALYGDLIIGNSVDSYSNLSLKTLSMLEWTDTYCPHSPRLLKTDDDVFVNVPRLLQFISVPQRANATLTLWGSLKFDHPKPIRSKGNRHYLSPVQFPPTEMPTYASGAAYVLTADAVRPLLDAAPAEPYVPLEDLFVTGILTGKVGITCHNADEFYSVATKPCTTHHDIARHVRYDALFKLWRRLLNLRIKCQHVFMGQF